MKRKKKAKPKGGGVSLKTVLLEEELYDGVLPQVSIVIPTYNRAYQLALTLDSIFQQKHLPLEVIIVDAHSYDPTMEITQRYSSQGVQLHSVSEWNIMEMYNRGITISKGRYVHFLQPGDYFLIPDALALIASHIAVNQWPDIVYWASLQPAVDDTVEVCYNSLTKGDLQQGLSPTFLKACIFRVETLRILGKFNGSFRVRGAFDFFCRFCAYPGLRVTSINRVFIDDQRSSWRYRFPLGYLQESTAIIYHYFGFKWALKWLVKQRPLRLLRFLYRSFHRAFFGS